MGQESPTIQHLSGLGLLAYMRGQGVDINEEGLVPPAPKVLLERYGQSTPVNLAVHLLLDDKNGEKARQFAQHCPPYKNNKKCKDIPRLRESFQKFVLHLLFSEKREEGRKEKSKEKPGEQGEIEDEQLKKLNEYHAQIDDWLDKWSEKYEKLVPHITEYLALLDDEYLDPKPESWQKDDDGSEFSAEDDEEEYIPNHHLDGLDRILKMFEAKIAILHRKIRRSKGKTEEQESQKKVLDIILNLLISLRSISWDILLRYPYGDSIMSRAEELINVINGILEDTK